MSAESRAKFLDSLFRLYIGLAVPFCFIIAVTSVIETTASLVLIPVWQYPVLVLIGGGKIALNRVFRTQRYTFGTVFREVLLVLIATSGLSYLLNVLDRFLGGGSNLGLQTLYLLFVLLVQWLLTFRLDALLLEYDRVRGFILMDAAREVTHDSLKRTPMVGQLSIVLRRIKVILTVLVVFYAGALVFFGWITGVVGPEAAVTAAVFLIAVFFGNLFLRFLQEEQQRFSQGLFTASSGARKRVMALLPLLVLAGVLSFFAANTKPLVDLSGVSLESPRPALWKQPRSSPESHPVTGLRWLDYLRRQTAGEKSAFAIFMDYVIYVFLGLLLLLFLVFPLFSRSVRKLLRLKRLRDFIKRTIIQCRDWIVLAVAVIKDFFRRRSAGRTDGEKGTVKRADDWRKSTGEMPVLRWAREEHRIVRQFRRLQRWAAGKRIHYRRGQTATEYVEEIAGRYPVQRERLIFILETFEQALFSNHFLTREEMRRYFENIRAVTRKR